jgi:hypothetical protein
MIKALECSVNNAIYALSAVLIWVLLSNSMQSNAATSAGNTANSTTPKKSISDNTLKVVNAAFYQTFVLGDWRYKGARNLGGTINAYIQIPAPLDMTRERQKSYLQTAICPSSDNITMWNEIDDIPLSIHIYVHKQKNSLYVNCTNPLIAG